MIDTTPTGPSPEPRPFAFEYPTWLRPLFVALGMGPRHSRVTIADGRLEVTMGRVFRLRVPLASIRTAERATDVWWAIGVHTGFNGSWLVNGSPRGIVALDLDPAGTASCFGVKVRVRRLGLGLAEPKAFLAALGL
jgi:hypothetical protein